MWPAGPKDGRDGSTAAAERPGQVDCGAVQGQLGERLAGPRWMRRGNGAAFQQDAFRRTGLLPDVVTGAAGAVTG